MATGDTPPPPTWSKRFLYGLRWGLLLSGSFGALMWASWQAGCRTTRFSNVELEPQDLISATVVFATGTISGAIIVAVMKPHCTSWFRCSLVAFLSILAPAAAIEM